MSKHSDREPIKRVITGMRTTGKAHLGHYAGAFGEWLSVQEKGEHEQFYLLANVQALTTHMDYPEILPASVNEMVLDWLAVGLNPYLDNVHFVLQSHVPERFELFALLMMITKHSQVMRNPTLKTELDKVDYATMGFMSYPVDEAADILSVSPLRPQHGDELLVPAGEDQAPLLELTRDIAEDFNKRFGKTFVIPTGKQGKISRLVGPDGKEKMGKSLGNAMSLSDTADEIVRKVKKMYTDPTRLRATDPGETVNNPVFVYLRAFSSNQDEVAQLTEEYQNGRVGDVHVKAVLARELNNMLDPIRQRREQFKNTNIREILMAGSEAASKVTKPVVEEVRDSMFLRMPK